MTSAAVGSNHLDTPTGRELTNNNNVVEKVASGNLDNHCKEENGDDRLGELEHGHESHLLRQRNVSRPELRHTQSEILPSDLKVDIEAQRKRSQTMEIAKEHAYSRLQLELNKAQEELKLKGEEVDKLVEVRDQMGKELEELTACLFEEANNMVQDANIKRMHSEKLLKEANEQIEVLQAELKALKQLVLTSTPSSPNKHLHPQIDPELQTKKEKTEHKKPFWKTHKRSTSHHEFTKEAQQKAEAEHEAKKDRCKELFREPIDQHSFDLFRTWRQSPLMDRRDGFLARVYKEDVQPCLNFANGKLAVRLQECVSNNSLTIEPIPGDNSYPRKCRLTDNNKLCNYKIKLGEDPEWYSISQLCRNRIASVCDYYTYVRYIQQGLVKSDDKEVFYEMVRLQKQMALARLGYS